MRLFVAVNLPHEEKLRLAAVLDRLRQLHPSVRWLDQDSLHITLQFLGQVPDTLVPSITDALDRAVQGTAPFDVDVSGFGAFPSLARPRVFWLGVQAPAQLAQLQSAVSAELEKLNFEPEARAWSPHITIARGTDRITADVEYKAGFRVQSVDLMRSHLGAKGARYERMHAAKLK